MPEENDSIALATDEPNIEVLIEEFQKAGASGNFFTRQRSNEETRLAIWENQSPTGKKLDENMPEGTEAFPFDGASDTRCFQADEVCNERAAVKTTAFWRAELRVSPVGVEDATDSTCATTFMDWLRYGKLQGELVTEVELSAQCDEEAGWFALHTTWDRSVAKKLKTIKLDELTAQGQQILQQLQESGTDISQLPPEQSEILGALIAYPDVVKNPELEQQAVAITQYLYRAYAEKTLPKELHDDISDLTVKRARKVVRELRKDGKAGLPMPYLCKNQPCIKALRPWVDIIVPGYAEDIETSPFVFLPMYYTEADVRNKVITDGWDAAWAEEVVKTAGTKSQWKLNDQATTVTWNQFTDASEDKQIEIVCAYVRQVDEDGVSSINYVYFSPHYKGTSTGDNEYAQAGLLNYPGSRYPIRLGRREVRDRCIITSRGIPELCATSQNEEKAQRDAFIDGLSLGVMPPLLTPKGALGQSKFKFGPAVENIVTVGREPKFMEMNMGGLGAADKFLAVTRQEVRRRFGLFDEAVPPALSQLMMEGPAMRFLTTWAMALYDAYQLACVFDPALVERVTGEHPPALDDVHGGTHDLTLHFDVGMLNPELWVQKMEAYGKLLTEDFAGVIDRAKYVAIKARLIDHRLAKELVTSQAPATERMQIEVQNDLTRMWSGTPPIIKDASNDPTAPGRLQFAQQTLASNQKMLAALDPEVALEALGQQYGQQYMMQKQQMMQMGMQEQQQQIDPMFTQFLEAYFQNLQMGADQQSNKQVGRTGINQNQ